MSEVQVLGFAALAAMAQQAAEAGVLKDMSVATSGGYNLLPEGNALARLVEYIELGSHNQVFKGTSKGSQPEMRLGFALYGKGYQSEDVHLPSSAPMILSWVLTRSLRRSSCSRR